MNPPKNQPVQTPCKPVAQPPQHRMMTMPRERGPVRASDILGPVVNKLAQPTKRP